MGTNYYLYEQDRCPECGRTDEPRHIGKASIGWCFGLHIYPEEGINDLADWRKQWAGKLIEDEYGTEIPTNEIERIITERARHGDASLTSTFYTLNHAEPGPNGLARHRIDYGLCIGHGEGTWDLCVGDFS